MFHFVGTKLTNIIKNKKILIRICFKFQSIKHNRRIYSVQMSKVHLVQDVELALGNELKDSVTVVLDSVTEELRNIGTVTKEQMWQMHESFLKVIGQTQKHIKELKLPPVKADILKLTDAGPGVGCSNVEVRFRDTETARILRSDRVNRVHRARDDSGRNEAERSNPCIGEALVDGGPLKWRYYEAFDNLTKEEIEELSLEDVKKREEEALEKNAWQVAKDVVERIQHEPGPKRHQSIVLL